MTPNSWTRPVGTALAVLTVAAMVAIVAAFTVRAIVWIWP